MKKVIISLIILVVIIFGLLTVLNLKNTEQVVNSDKLDIIATVYPVYDFTREIAGDKANVSMLLAPGVEIHDYEPTPQDIIKIQDSELFLYLGDKLEPWAGSVISGLDSKDNIKDISHEIEFAQIEDEEEHEHEEEEYDTHIWLDPLKSIQLVQNITDEICSKDPQNEEYYREREKKYITKLSELDYEFEQVTKNAEGKEIVFAGPFSYSYLMNRYNLNYASAYDSCGENSEPSIDKIIEIIEEIKKYDIKYIFNKELSSGNIAKTISEETNTEILELHSLHSVTKEEMDRGETYLNIMYKNLENIKKALQ